jgi:sulfite exporter TauE/SafE
MSRLGNRLRTVGRILRHFMSWRRWFLVPLLVVLLLAGLLLLATGGLSYVAPFLYSIF